MAEFKLGRLRFVWKNDWETGTVYYQDDVVAFGGKIYICVIGHTSNTDFFADLDITPPKWNLVSDGQSWKGEWQPQTEYVYDDIVKYGGKLYICQEVHTSAIDSTTGLEADINNWAVFAEGLEWKGDWSLSFDYKENDIVKYGGSTYVCNTAHISAATEALGLEEDLAKWDLFNQGFDYKGTWASDTRYKVNDVVRFGANTYIASTYHTSASQFSTDSAYWTKFVDGFQYESDWVYFGTYQAGDIVKYGGNQYIALTENSNKIPSTQTDDWNLFAEGFRYRGDWGDDSSNVDYLVGDLVRYGSYTYRCILDHNGQEPPNTTYWARFNTGIDWRGEWLDDQFYYEGDVVRYGDNSYICINSHISEGDDFSTETATEPGGGAENSRPDLDITGTYWNIIAIGSETSVLTTTGDMVYYGGAGPTRLPIGQDGQVLTVSPAGIPEWATLDFVDDVYFVAEHGTDSPAPIYGKSIDRPFKTIRYATQQIEKGARNPDAAKLLELNRRFVQREIVEWIDAQITGATSPFTSDFDYDATKCERDMGFIIDALIWDITHGGNVRSREAALSYVNDAARFYALGQEAETVAAINYGLTVIEDVLAQTDPTVNYQVTNGDNSTAIVEQYKNATLSAESGVLTDITTLVGIITDAITAGNSDNIPERLIRTTLVRVSTGYYKEVLPIIVPAECCIMGDELRATNVQPRTVYNSADTLTPISDFQYTYEGIKHIEDIVGDIITGVGVTPETGNTETQDQSWPYAETTVVSPAVQKLARSIRRKIDADLGTKIESNLKPAYDMVDPEFGYLRNLNLLNKEFVQAEIIAFITDQYPNLKYSRTKCKQDVGFILDALAYDLTYGGNWQSVKAGEAYWEGATLNISTSEKTATLAAYGYLRDLVQTVGRNLTVTPTYQDVVEQISGTAGSTTASNTARDLINDIIDIITNGSGSVSITYPDLSGTDSVVKEQFELAESNISIVQEKTIDFINENFGSFTYKSSKCRRDLDLIINDTAYDVALGTNYNAVFIGQAYQRPINEYNLSNQRIETVGAIRNTRDELIESVTTDGSSASGSSNAATRIRTAYNEIVDIINNGSGNADALTFSSPAGVDQNRVDAKDNLVANKDFIKAEIIAWISAQIVANVGNPGSIWYQFTYDSTKCERDVGFIVDAMCYDILYGGTMATTRIAQSYFTGATAYPAGQAQQTAAAYDRLATVMFYVVQEDTGSWTKTTTEVQTTPGTPATATEAAIIRDDQMQIIEDVITAGNLSSLPDIIYPDITWADAEYQTAFSNIASDKNDVIKSTIQFITNTYNDFVYDHTKCSRDLGIILNAAKYDTLLETNYASINAGLSYLRAPSTKVLGDQKTATLAANEYARQQLTNYILSGTGQTGLNTTWEWVQDIVWSGSTEGGNSAVADQEVWNAIRQLELNKEFIVEEVLNHVDNTFRDRVTGIDADTDEITISDTSWMSTGMPIKFYNDEDAGDSTDAVNNANLLETLTYYVVDITSATTFTISLDQYGSAEDLADYGEGFIVEKAYVYDRTLCARDVREYIDAMKWDLQWPQEWNRTYSFTNVELDNNGTTTETEETTTIYLTGFYKSSLASRYYVNSIIGSQEEDFYYLRNGTGLRLQTLDGLRGDLSPANAYGTSRPTAGAYASLDPGWGPDDQRVWITARSPYVQNLTTFGFAATGQKIDGSLHNGGNDSIVSNDFTQVISDGIGAWITNNGRAELVSVFTYYSHIGYLAENGGRIRGTNGNNSYGTFGSVAEGVDVEETPVTAIVDNKLQYNAVISNVFTNGADELLQLEYSHAGNDYTEAVVNIFGAGDSEELVMEDFRDEAVNNVRIIEVDDSTGNPDATAGGSGYLIVTNTAQTGSTSSITLAATDGNLSTAYPGMKLYITSGAGVGQYGIIDTYNSGSKIATIVKESDGTSGWDHIVPGTTIVAANSSSTYLIEPRAQFTAPTKSNSQETGISGDYSKSEFIETSAQYTGISVVTQSDGTGATFDVTRNGERYYLELATAGTGYSRLDTMTIVGTSVGGATTTNDIEITVTAVDASTGEILAYEFTGIARKGVFVALPTSGTAGQYSIDGSSWSATTLATSASWTDLVSGKVDDGTTTFTQSYAVAAGISGGAAVANYSLNGTSWTASSPTGLSATSRAAVAFGQIATAISRWVVIADNDQDVAYSDNGGQTWTTTSTALPSTGYTDIAYGVGKFVAIKSGSQEMAYSEDAITWTTVATGMPNTNNWSRVVFGNGRFVAVAADSTTVAYSLDGENWTAVSSALVTSPVLDIAYGQGMFVVATDDTNQVSYSEDGVYWPSGGYTLSNSYTGGIDAVSFGNPGRDPKFIAFSSGTSTGVLNAKIGATAKGRVGVANEQVFEVRITDPGSGYGTTAPTLTITDPNNINDVLYTVRINDGVLAQPTFVARGSGFITATAEVDGTLSNGSADFFQDGQFIAVRQLSATPVNGSNVVFDSLPDQVFKLVNTVSLVGTIDGAKTAFLQISPSMEIEDAVVDQDPVTMRIRFSQVRLTGHDFLDIGTGNFVDTNYPGDPVNEPDADSETLSSNGGRVFFTSTDQDGNFKVGDLFSIEQATGVATLNAEAFNIAGLQELSLGEVTLGGNSASVTEFSTDPFFTANSDSVVPTQRAIKAYIEAQIGGGGASLIVNSVTAGDIFINGTQITTVSGALINIKANVNFQGTVLGTPLAYNYFLR